MADLGPKSASNPKASLRLSLQKAAEEIELDVRRSISQYAPSLRSSPFSASFFHKSLSRDPILGASNWRGDVETFCSAVFSQPDSKKARVIKIQARKSKKLPFRHEFLLVYVLIDGNMKVIRIDRLGKLGGIFGLGEGRMTALEEVRVFDLGYENADAWQYDNNNRGSVPIATLFAHEELEPTRTSSGETSHPMLSLTDIARILTFMQAEMPTYVLTTKNCFMMTRSILMILCNCFGDSHFVCYLGDENSPEGPVSATFLDEPLYNGIIRWYLPVVLAALIAYILLMLGVHWLLEVRPISMQGIGPVCSDKRSYWDNDACPALVDAAASKVAPADSVTVLRHGGTTYLHASLDIPFPCAVIHWPPAANGYDGP